MSILGYLKTGLDNSLRSLAYRPEGAIIFLTYRCTSKCSTCNIWKRPARGEAELSWDEWKPIIASFAENGLHSIELFGGDALLRKDLLLQMIRFCNEVGIETYFPTNAKLIDEDTARELVDAGLDVIYFSLDELLDMKERIRGPVNTFARVDKAARMVREARGERDKPQITCITTVSRLNSRYLDDFLEYVDAGPFDSYSLRGFTEFDQEAIDESSVDGTPPDPLFVSTTGKSNRFQRGEAEGLVRTIKKIKMRNRDPNRVHVGLENLEFITPRDLVEGTYPDVHCQFIKVQMVLTPSADVVPCIHYTNYVLGNLRDSPYTDIWGNKKHRQFCRYNKEGKMAICKSCSIKFYHNSFSRAVSNLIRKAGSRLHKAA